MTWEAQKNAKGPLVQLPLRSFFYSRRLLST